MAKTLPPDADATPDKVFLLLVLILRLCVWFLDLADFPVTALVSHDILTYIGSRLVHQEVARAAAVCRRWRSAFSPLLNNLHVTQQMPATLQLLVRDIERIQEHTRSSIESSVPQKASEGNFAIMLTPSDEQADWTSL